MSPGAKARIVGAVVALVALWPIAHRVLVVRYDTNPWKLYGFAMYTTPHVVRVELHDSTAGGHRRIDPRRLPPDAQRAFLVYERLRRTLGRLHPPDELAQTLFDALPGVRRLEVTVRLWRLPPFEDSVRQRVTSYRFERS